MIVRLSTSVRQGRLKRVAQRSLPNDGLGVPTTALVVTGSGKLLALGTVRQEILLVDATNLEVAGRMDVGGRPTYLERVDDQRIAVATAQGKVAVFRVATRKRAWERELGAIEGSPERVGEAIVVLSTDRRLHFLDVTTGEDRFKAAVLKAGDRVVRDALGGLVYVWSARRKLATIHPATGKVLGQRSMPLEPEELVAIGGALAVVHRERHGLLVLDGESLTPLWATETQTPIRSVAADARGLIAVLANKRLVAYGAAE